MPGGSLDPDVQPIAISFALDLAIQMSFDRNVRTVHHRGDAMWLARRIEYVRNAGCSRQCNSKVRRRQTERPSSGQKRAERQCGNRQGKRQWNREVKIAGRIPADYRDCDRVDRRNPFKQAQSRDRR